MDRLPMFEESRKRVCGKRPSRHRDMMRARSSAALRAANTLTERVCA